ncbi:MAG: hypothetical protein RJP95_02650 [Pirellulales bacterium]
MSILARAELLTAPNETERKTQNQREQETADDRDMQLKEVVEKEEDYYEDDQLPEIVGSHSRGLPFKVVPEIMLPRGPWMAILVRKGTPILPKQRFAIAGFGTRTP